MPKDLNEDTCGGTCGIVTGLESCALQPGHRAGCRCKKHKYGATWPSRFASWGIILGLLIISLGANDPEATRCWACKKKIAPGTKTCPYCRKAQ